MPTWGDKIIAIRTPITFDYDIGGPEIVRLFIERDGVPTEIIRNFDCDGHFITRDRREDICPITGQMKEIAPEFLAELGKARKCTHVCPHKKRVLKQGFEQHGQYIPEDARAFMLEYLAEENTIEEAKPNG